MVTERIDGAHTKSPDFDLCPVAAWFSQAVRSDMLVYICMALRYSHKGMVSAKA